VSWEAVIGVEIHVQLRSERKLFCGDRVTFGSAPNTHVCPVCLGLPGALPTLNPSAVMLGVRTALALGCTVHRRSDWARKNYFYPDLPKGYQITQLARPLATDGRLRFDGEIPPGEVRIRRVHMEEDAGKSVHDRLPHATGVDLNRAGTPLVEIVTEPDLRTPADARAFLSALKRTLEYVDVSDCNMEEGSLRVDANVSVRRSGAAALGTKTEIKNVNSFSGIEKALDLEIARQVGLVEGGGAVRGETLLWDDHRSALRPMRTKEESHDYRYFPEPDLPPLILDRDFIESAREVLPELPRARMERFETEYGLTRYEADVLTQTSAGAAYFESVTSETGDPKLAANWMMGPVQALMNARRETAMDFPVRPADLGELLGLVTDGTVSDSVAKRVLGTMADDGRGAAEIVRAEGVEQVRDEGVVAGWIEEVFSAFPDEVERGREGEGRIVGFLVGQVMRRSADRADPRQVNEAIRARLRHPKG